MRYVIVILLSLCVSTTYGDTYSLLDNSEYELVEYSNVAPEENVETSLEDLEVLTEDENIAEDHDSLKYWHDAYLYLFGTTGLTVSGFIGRLLYLMYQTKRGKLIVKHVKNTTNELEKDIIDNIIRITDLETGDKAREVLKNIQKELLEIAKKKLPPK